MKTLSLRLLVSIVAGLFMTTLAAAHCEIPCGIYDDEMRIEMILEHITTIEKSMRQIIAHDKQKPHNANQLTRWVMNKENHANDLQEIVSQYFMTQRIKPGVKSYQPMLTNLHEMLIYSMKCKQTTDLEHPKRLKRLVEAFKKLYFSSEH